MSSKLSPAWAQSYIRPARGCLLGGMDHLGQQAFPTYHMLLVTCCATILKKAVCSLRLVIRYSTLQQRSSLTYTVRQYGSFFVANSKYSAR